MRQMAKYYCNHKSEAMGKAMALNSKHAHCTVFYIVEKYSLGLPSLFGFGVVKRELIKNGKLWIGGKFIAL